MLKTPEMAMNPNPKVTTKCYGKLEKWDDREQAKEHFLNMSVIQLSIFSL